MARTSSYHTLSFFPAQQCSEGWSQVGEACLRINSSRESYDNAQHYCKNLNGNIASLTTSKQVDFVLEELNKLQQQDKVNIKACSKYGMSNSVRNIFSYPQMPGNWVCGLQLGV